MANMMRPMVSYDDITLPYGTNPSSQHSPPPKKRKWSKKSKGRNPDDSQSISSFPQGKFNNIGAPDASLMVMEVEENVEEDEEGRELSHHEIWDDSALVDAWNAATEEYEAYNGPEKGWKAEPVHNSPLWYNTPKTKAKISAPTKMNRIVSMPSVPELTEEQEDSRPLNFDTFIPLHDPSLAVPVLDPDPTSGLDDVSQFLSEPPGPMVSQDEAFTRAIGAMYWSGYWTAMYHCQRHLVQEQPAEAAAQNGDEELCKEAEDAEEEEEAEEDESFVLTQR